MLPDLLQDHDIAVAAQPAAKEAVFEDRAGMFFVEDNLGKG